MRIYLAGEMHTDWRGELIEMLEVSLHPTQRDSVEWVLPHVTPDRDGDGSGTADWYVTRDLLCLNRCDLVFAMISDRGRNIGTSAEIGYAYAQGKPIIMCCTSVVHSYDFVKKLAMAVSPTLRDAADVLVHAVRRDHHPLSSREASSRLRGGHRT